jgi:hypothetical protein
LRNGSSGFSDSLNSKFAPVVFGVHHGIDMPLGVWKKPMRGTPFGAADRAGTMASNIGNARMVPTPRRNVRRGKVIFVITIAKILQVRE